MPWIPNKNKENKKDKILFFSFFLSFILHSSLILYILIGYQGENKRKEIVWVSLHTFASDKSDQKDSNMGGVSSEQKPGGTDELSQNNPLLSESKVNREKEKIKSENGSSMSDIKSQENMNTKHLQEKEKKEEIKDQDKKQQDKKERVVENKIKRSDKDKEKSKYVKKDSKLKKGLKEKKEFVKEKGKFVRNDKPTEDEDKSKGDKRNKKELISKNISGEKSKSQSVKRSDGEVKEKYSAKDLDELESALRELAKSYNMKGKKGGGEGGGNIGGGTENGEFDQTFISLYAQLIREGIKKNFVIPPSFKGEFLSCVVYLKIGEDGSILDMDLEESSGNRNFDIFVMKAIRDSSPFPPPPSELELYVRFSNRD